MCTGRIWIHFWIMPNRKINDMYDNIVVHFHMCQKCGNFQCSVIMHTFQSKWMHFLIVPASKYKYWMYIKCIPKLSIIFQIHFNYLFHGKWLKRCVIMMYSLYTRFERACVYTLIKYIIKFKMFVQKETLARAMVKVYFCWSVNPSHPQEER